MGRAWVAHVRPIGFWGYPMGQAWRYSAVLGPWVSNGPHGADMGLPWVTNGFTAVPYITRATYWPTGRPWIAHWFVGWLMGHPLISHGS